MEAESLDPNIEPPYYAVIFASVRSMAEPLEYEQMAGRMIELARHQPGFLGVVSARETLGITVSYWSNLKSIRNWKRQIEHAQAQAKGRSGWYKRYSVKVAKVVRAYDFEAAGI